MKFLKGSCHDDVITPRSDDISKHILYSYEHAGEHSRKSFKRNFWHLLWFKSFSAKSRHGVFLPPPGSMNAG